MKGMHNLAHSRTLLLLSLLAQHKDLVAADRYDLVYALRKHNKQDLAQRYCKMLVL